MVLALNEKTQNKGTQMTKHLMKASPSIQSATREFLDIHFDTPDIVVIQKAIAQTHATNHTDCVQGMHLLGDSGTGKSYIAKNYANDYPRYVEDGQEIVPILYVSLLQKSTTNSLMVRLLRTLTGLRKITAREEEVQDRLIKRLEAANTKLIFIDEAQHLTRESSSISAQHAADAIKALMDATGIPIVCVSIDSSLALLIGRSKFKKEKQLRRRNRRMYSIQPYDLGTEHWIDLISQFQSALNCKEDLTSSNMLKRMHIATYGLFGNLIPFFKEAIEITGCSQKIDMDVLGKAYIEFQPNNELTFNPFETTMSTIEAEITFRLNARIEASAIEQA
jgi:DNA transposition AAA+ family ATPase